MVRGNVFGGQWTERKLTHLRKYLDAYMTIFAKNVNARYYRTVYIDAFAGTGYRVEAQPDVKTRPMFATPDDLKDGSAIVALRTEPPFSRYVLVEINRSRAQKLEQLKLKFPDRNIEVHCKDANRFLKEFCAQTDWEIHRAVVFLDPYGMSVDFDTLRILGQTEAVDLWLLFPLSAGPCRLLGQSPPDEESWKQILTRTFGTDEWLTKFYRRSGQLRLDGRTNGMVKDADYKAMLSYFKDRLNSVFHSVAKNHRLLMNSKNSPMYALLFAVANPKKADLAIQIANNILKD